MDLKKINSQFVQINSQFVQNDNYQWINCPVPCAIAHGYNHVGAMRLFSF